MRERELFPDKVKTLIQPKRLEGKRKLECITGKYIYLCIYICWSTEVKEQKRVICLSGRKSFHQGHRQKLYVSSDQPLKSGQQPCYDTAHLNWLIM